MDSRDRNHGAASSLVRILRRITRIVQIAPFAYLLLLAVCLLGESFMPDWMLRISVNLLSTPAYATVGMLIVGRWLKLCSWFRTACLLPFTTKVEGYVDAFVYTFTQDEVVVVNTALALAFLTFIYLTYRHFFHGRS